MTDNGAEVRAPRSLAGSSTDEARITVVFPAHRAEDAVADLVAAIGGQRPPAGIDPGGWLKAIFIDDGSPDQTFARLSRELERADLPFEVRVMRNETNLGLAGSLNRALATVNTEYVLTCHADCRFGSEDYVATVIELLDRHPDVAAVSGQSIADVDSGLSQVEKVYLAANVMDIFPEGVGELESVGFAEGRCDGFRMEVMREAGFYDTTLHRAGEDQVLAARMRTAGYRVCRAPALRYYLSVSSYQDSLTKLVRHAALFGRVTPYLIFSTRGTVAGVVGARAGRNRSLRSALRASQLVGAVSLVGLAAATATGRSRRPAAGGLAATGLLKSALFYRYVRYLRFEPRDVAALVALQPALDLAYTAGCVKGLWQELGGRRKSTIA